MGYSARYHGASLAAVLVALAVGILLGSQFGSDVLTGARKNLEQSLTRDLDASRNEVRDLKQRIEWSDNFGAAVLPGLVAGRLEGSRIGLVGLGDLPEAVTKAVEGALGPADASLAAVVATRGQVNFTDLAATLRGSAYARLDRKPKVLARFGRQLGRELVDGGPLPARTRGALLDQSNGRFVGLDGIVLYRNGNDTTEEGADFDPELQKTLEDSLVEGLTRAGARVTGAELLASNPSATDWFRDHNLPTVDNVDQPSGKLSLVYVLSGVEGSFGVKSGASRLMPELLGLQIRAGSGTAGKGRR